MAKPIVRCEEHERHVEAESLRYLAASGGAACYGGVTPHTSIAQGSFSCPLYWYQRGLGLAQGLVRETHLHGLV